MANGKRSGRRAQAQRTARSKSSQQDKRQRLTTPNRKRQSTDVASVPMVGGIAVLAAAMSRLIDKRIAFRLPIVMPERYSRAVAGRLPAGFDARASKTIGIASMNFFIPSAIMARP